MPKKIVGLLVFIAAAAGGIAMYSTYKINHMVLSANLVSNASTLMYPSVNITYGISGSKIVYENAELTINFDKIKGLDSYNVPPLKMVVKFPEKVTLTKGFFSNKINLVTSGKYQVAVFSQNNLITPVITNTYKSEVMTFGLDVGRVMPWNKAESIFDIVKDMKIDAKGGQQFINKELLSKQEHILVNADWKANEKKDGYKVNFSYDITNAEQTSAIDIIDEFVWQKSMQARGETSLPLVDVLNLYNANRPSPSLIIPSSNFKGHFSFAGCKEIESCYVEFGIDNADSISNLSKVKVDDFLFKIKSSSGSNSEIEGKLDLDLKSINLHLNEKGYEALVSAAKKNLVQEFFSHKIDPVKGYLGLVNSSLSKQAPADLLFAGYFKDFFIPHQWVSSFNIGYKVNLNSQDVKSAKASFNIEMLDNDSKVHNAFSFNMQDNNNFSAKISMASPYDSFTNLMDYLNKVSEYAFTAGIDDLMKLDSNFPSVASRLISGVSSKDENNVSLINITTKKMEVNGHNMNNYFIGDNELISFAMQASQELSGTLVPAAKPKSSMNEFVKSVADKGLGIASYTYAVRKFGSGDVDEALKYALKADEQGVVPAYSLLGFLYTERFSRTKDIDSIKKAKHYMKNAAKYNDPYAKLSLGALLTQKDDVDFKSSRYYLDQAKQIIEMTSSFAGLNLGEQEMNSFIEFNMKSASNNSKLYIVAINDHPLFKTIFVDGEFNKDMISREIEAYIQFPSLIPDAVDLNKYPANLRGYAMNQLQMANIKVKNAPKPKPAPSPVKPTENQSS